VRAPERPRGAIDAALARSNANRQIAVVAEAAGRHAVTRYTVLETYGGGPAKKPIASLLELELETGRTHQIRVHLAHVGHPLLGDMTYGAGFKASARNLSEEAQTALAALGRQALHAGGLAFVPRLRASGCASQARCRPTWRGLLLRWGKGRSVPCPARGGAELEGRASRFGDRHVAPPAGHYVKRPECTTLERTKSRLQERHLQFRVLMGRGGAAIYSRVT
jgi:hypothetical protein